MAVPPPATDPMPGSILKAAPRPSDHFYVRTRRSRRSSPATVGRRAAGLLAVAALGLLAVAGPVGADPGSDLDQANQNLDQANQQAQSSQQQLGDAEARLNDLIAQILDQSAAVAKLEARATDLAEIITASEDRIAATEGRIVDQQQQVADTRAAMDARQAELNRRAWVTYIYGPGNQLETLMSATTLADLATRLEIADRAAEYDQSLVDGLARDRAVLSIHEQELESIQAEQLDAQADLDARRAELDAVLGEEQATLAALDQAKADALALVQQASTAHAQALQQQALAEAEQKAAQTRFEAFQAAHGGAFVPGVLNVCPVDQPRAYGDSFGAPRYAGGYHPHAGNDILAPGGTPIRAPFDGVAREANNNLGGLSVIVEGANGWVYNAHLSGFGQLGPVTAGTVIGYVGNTGDAQGGPTHDHFEWHPNVMPANPWVSPYGYSVIGTAVDPYPYLNAVC